jgi:GMP synthase-like glutamine amidotransferase
MKIGILEPGAPPSALRESFGDYGAMFRAILGEGFEAVSFDVAHGAWPDSPEALPAWLITGSSAGVYDERPWIAPLMAFLRAAKGRSAIVGICFGHQIMAQAFSGQVVKSPKGWGIGLHRYAVQAPQPWMGSGVERGSEFAIPASHQDQVVAAPPGTVVTASSAFTPYAGLAYDDGRSISFQGHPEFDPAYAAALITARRGSLYAEDQATAAITSLNEPNDRGRVAEWIRAFLQKGLEAGLGPVLS